MEKLYALCSDAGAEEYIKLTGEFAELSGPCRRGEPQYLTRDPVAFEIAEEGGLEIPDVLAQEGVLFVSDQFRAALMDAGQNHLFFKRVDVDSVHFGIHETFWITVVPRIDCLDAEASGLEGCWDAEDGVIPCWEPARICINPACAGRYGIFRLLGVADDTVYVREPLYRKLCSAGFAGLDFFEL